MALQSEMPSREGYLRRCLAFVLAMTAKGEATVITMSAKTNSKRNMLARFLQIQRWNRTRMARRKDDSHNSFAGGNGRKVAG